MKQFASLIALGPAFGMQPLLLVLVPFALVRGCW